MNVKKNGIYLVIGILVVVVFYVAFTSYRDSPDRLFARLQFQMKEDRFAELYDESSDYVRSSLTKEQFVKQMRVAVTKLRGIDANLDFERDMGWERTTPAGFPEEQGFVFTVQKLKKNDAAFAIVYWDNTGIFPRFKDIIITQTDDPDGKWLNEYEFKGVLSSEN